MDVNRFKKYLKRQLHLLRNSCHFFDKGACDEAVRIATCIRVIVHDTGSSTSILKHLDAKDIRLFTTHHEPPKQNGDSGFYSITAFAMGVINMGHGGKYGYGANLEDFNPNCSAVLPVKQWWNQVVWILDLDARLTRKGLILGAADKDGGAHVDGELEPKYEQLATQSWGTITVGPKGAEPQRIDVKHMHLMAIRTVGNEILKSPELLSLLE